MSTEAALFGKRLCLARLALGWTQEELAEKASISRTNVANYERGANAPGLFRAVALARTVGVSLDRLTAPERGTP